jgi:hypothetical protein
MKRGKRELKARMVALQQKNNRKISHLNELLRQREEILFETRKDLVTTSAMLNDALLVVEELKKKKWYQFVPIKPLEQ